MGTKRKVLPFGISLLFASRNAHIFFYQRPCKGGCQKLSGVFFLPRGLEGVKNERFMVRLTVSVSPPPPPPIKNTFFLTVKCSFFMPSINPLAEIIHQIVFDILI